jgi:phage recombination protein Bet
MNQIARLDNREVTLGGWNKRQLDTMKRSVAPDATELEFENFLQYAIAQRLDPFLGHVILVIYSKDDPKKRKATIIVTQAGSRVIAARCRDYRPAEEPAKFVYDESIKGRPIHSASCPARSS